MAETIDQNTVTEVDFKEKKKGHSYQVEADGGIPKFLRDMAKFAKSHNVKAAFVMTVDGNNHVDWMPFLADEHVNALMCLAMEDARNGLKAHIFEEDPDDV